RSAPTAVAVLSRPLIVKLPALLPRNVFLVPKLWRNGTPSFKMLPTVGSAESGIVRLPGTSTSCACAPRYDKKLSNGAENKSILSLRVLTFIVDSLLQLRALPNSAGATTRHSTGRT